MFSNAIVFRLPKNWEITLESLTEQLGRRPFRPCGASETVTRGWVGITDNGLVHSVAGQWIFAMQTQTRLLPAFVVREETKKRAKALEQQQGFAPGRKQVRELKELVAQELLAKAFTKDSRTLVWIDRNAGFLVIDTGSNAKADEVIDLLCGSIDDLPLKLIHTKRSPNSVMADWLASGQPPAGFTIDRDCELKSVSDEKSAVRYVSHALDGEEIEDEIKHHLASGKLPTKLALTYNSRVSFVFSADGIYRRISFIDTAPSDAESMDEQLDADIAIMAGELRPLFESMIDELGGEEVKE